MEQLRAPLLIVAVALIALAVLVELGSIAAVGVPSPAAAALDVPRPGHGIPYLALLDGLVLFTVGLIAAGVIVPERVQGRVQGIVTLIVSLLLLLAAIAMIIAAIVLLSLMIGLLLSPIFGTVAYFALFGRFDRAGASIALSLIMLLKLGFAASLLLAHQRFLQNRGLVLLVLTSLLASVVVSFLHGIVPSFLVSITDVVAAIVVAILAAIWAVIFLVGSVVSVLKAVRVDRALA